MCGTLQFEGLSYHFCVLIVLIHLSIHSAPPPPTPSSLSPTTPSLPPPHSTIPPPSTPEDDIRLRVLTVLDSKFDTHLTQPENITTLFIALHDENFCVEEVGLTYLLTEVDHLHHKKGPLLRQSKVRSECVQHSHQPHPVRAVQCCVVASKHHLVAMATANWTTWLDRLRLSPAHC